MALKFKCKNCGEDIIVKHLKPGEIAKCRLCGAENEVPETATPTDEEQVITKAPAEISEEQRGEKGAQIKKKKPAGPVRKVFSVILISLGLFLLVATVFPDLANIILGVKINSTGLVILIILCIAFTWIGAALWERWRTGAGVIAIVFAVFSLVIGLGLILVGNVLVFTLGAVYLMGGVILLIIGIALITSQIIRDKREKTYAPTDEEQVIAKAPPEISEEQRDAGPVGTEEKKPAGPVKRVFGFLMISIGVVFTAAAVVSALFRILHGIRPDYGVGVVMIIVGIALIWGGAALARR